MTFRLFNTLGGRKQDFIPIDPYQVRLYCCGPTVYDRAHVGNARPVVVFDVLFRLLRHQYGADHVLYVRNITDIEDKIIQAAAKNRETIEALTGRTIAYYHQDMNALGALPPTYEPKATEYIPEMCQMIEYLVRAGYAYVADGHVLFHVLSAPNYGCLSNRSQDEMIAGSRVEVAPYKKHPADFVLWKPSADDQPGWDSPWGRGRPGWHIECSAMAGSLLGDVFDIHGGGLDLIFPHHENEIAQSSCSHNGLNPAHYWLHNGFVQVNGQKMSKSTGNFFTVRQLMEEGFAGETIRLCLLSAHYRQPLDISRAALQEAKQHLDRFYQTLRGGNFLPHTVQIPSIFLEALEDDLNVPLALTRLHELASAINKADEKQKPLLQAQLKNCANLLGILQHPVEQWFQQSHLPQSPQALSDAEIKRRIEDRVQARQAKNFQKADEIRQVLEKSGIILEDKATGTVWRRV